MIPRRSRNIKLNRHGTQPEEARGLFVSFGPKRLRAERGLLINKETRRDGQEKRDTKGKET